MPIRCDLAKGIPTSEGYANTGIQRSFEKTIGDTLEMPLSGLKPVVARVRAILWIHPPVLLIRRKSGGVPHHLYVPFLPGKGIPTIPDFRKKALKACSGKAFRVGIHSAGYPRFASKFDG